MSKHAVLSLAVCLTAAEPVACSDFPKATKLLAVR